MTTHTPSIALNITEAVAKRKGVPPKHLNESLFSAIDPEALESLFNNGEGYVSFTYCGFFIQIDHNSNIELFNLPETE